MPHQNRRKPHPSPPSPSTCILDMYFPPFAIKKSCLPRFLSTKYDRSVASISQPPVNAACRSLTSSEIWRQVPATQAYNFVLSVWITYNDQSPSAGFLPFKTNARVLEAQAALMFRVRETRQRTSQVSTRVHLQ